MLKVLFWLAILATPLESTVASSLEIKIDGFKSSDGLAFIAVHQEKKTFLKKTAPFRAAKVPIKEGEVRFRFDDLPPGTYSVAVFHDMNGNEDLDRNLIGIPQEAYGFSNNARGKYGPPKFEDTLVEFTGSKLTLSITVQ